MWSHTSPPPTKKAQAGAAGEPDPPSSPASPSQEAPCPGAAGCASSQSLWPGGFPGEPGGETASAPSSARRGQRATRSGWEGPCPRNLPNRAGVIKGEHPCPSRASAWEGCAPGGWGGRDRQVPAGCGRRRWGLLPPHPCALPPLRRPWVCRCPGHHRPKIPGGRGAAGTPLRNSPLSRGTGEPVTPCGAGTSARRARPPCFAKV